jgi:hypothetical protein
VGDGGGEEVEDDLIRLTRTLGPFGVLLTKASSTGIAGDPHCIGILSIHLDSFITRAVGLEMSLVRYIEDRVILIRSAANFIRSAASVHCQCAVNWSSGDCISPKLRDYWREPCRNILVQLLHTKGGSLARSSDVRSMNQSYAPWFMCVMQTFKVEHE